MTEIDNSSILSIFPLIRSAIISNSTLSARFNTQNIYQFEPKHKAGNFGGFPYFWANIPSTDSSKLTFTNSVVPHSFDVTVLLRMDWEARDNVLNYCNAFLKAMADYELNFEVEGYYDVMVSLIDVNPNQSIQKKQVVESEFLITFQGQVQR